MFQQGTCSWLFFSLHFNSHILSFSLHSMCSSLFFICTNITHCASKRKKSEINSSKGVIKFRGKVFLNFLVIWIWIESRNLSFPMLEWNERKRRQKILKILWKTIFLMFVFLNNSLYNLVSLYFQGEEPSSSF